MSAKGKRVIWVGPADGSNAKPANLEAVATTAIKPGTVLNFAAADAGFVANTVAATVFGELFLVADKDQARAKSVDDNCSRPSTFYDHGAGYSVDFHRADEAGCLSCHVARF